MPAVELDIKLAQAKLKLEELRQDFRRTERAAADTKLAEKMEAGMKKSTVDEFRGMKERAQKAAHDAALAAAAEWKRIVTPAVNESWGTHRAGSGGAMTPGGGSRLAIGNVGMQIQDIAVQAQMGTSAFTIFAQQGSQLASIFGPTGMIVGGIAAIGGGLLMAGKKGDEAFKEMIKGAADFHAELEKIITTGTVDSISDAMGRLAKSQADIAAAAQKLNAGSFWDFSKGVLGVMTGGDSLAEKKSKAQEALRASASDERALNEAAMIASDRALQVANLKAAGKDKEAAALERQFKLLTEIQKIQNSSFSDDTKKQLISDATAISAAEGAENPETIEKKWKDAADKRRSAAEQYAAAEHAVAVAAMTEAEKLLDLGKQRLALEDKIKAAGTDEEKVRLATERERIEAQIVSMQMQMGKAGEADAKARNEKIEAMKKDLAGKEKSLSKLENPVPAQTFHAPGSVSSQFDWAMGGGSSLVSESTDRNTAAMDELKAEIKALKEKLGPLTVTAIPVFPP